MNDERDRQGITERFAEVRAGNGLFPMTPIEGIAAIAYEGLADLKDRMKPEELGMQPHDIRMRIYLNGCFVRERLSRHVIPLMRRTDPQPVWLGPDEEDFGYEWFPGDADDDDGEIRFIYAEGCSVSIETPDLIQATWDKSAPIVRQKLRKFANVTRREILDDFMGYTREYLE